MNRQPKTRKPRLRPYTNREIVKIGCVRCGAPSSAQWQVCADGNQFRGLCSECDIELNRLILKFFEIPNAAQLLAKYRKIVKERLRELLKAVVAEKDRPFA